MMLKDEDTGGQGDMNKYICMMPDEYGVDVGILVMIATMSMITMAIVSAIMTTVAMIMRLQRQLRLQR